MNNINLSQKSYVDYVASLYFNALGVANVEFSVKPVKVGDQEVGLIHVSGVQKTTGVIVNVDLWPRDNAADGELAKLQKGITDIEFRVGYWPKVDENGETTLEAGAPKVTAYYIGEKRVVLSGGKREFAE